MSSPVIPEVLPAAPVLGEAPTVEPVRRPAPGRSDESLAVVRRWVVAFLGWCWRIPVGILFCLTYPTSILVMGWSYRRMQGVVLRGWWKRSPRRGPGTFEEFAAALGHQAPVVRPRWFLQERIGQTLARPAPNGKTANEFRTFLRILKVPLHSLWLNFKTGILALACTYLLTGWGCLFMFFSWEFGWLNSFNKGYEEWYFGPLTGWLGILLFILAMLYVPMAQVHQAVTGDFRAFFDFRFVFRLIHARLGTYMVLAGLITLASLPLEILKTAPLFFDGYDPAWTDASADEVAAGLWLYFLFCGVFVFPTLLVLHFIAAHVYRSAVQKVVRRGWVTRQDLHPTLHRWLDGLGLIPVPAVETAGLVWAVRVSGSWTYRWCVYWLLFWIWFGFIAKVYAGEFFHYHPFVGFMNHPLIQFPCLSYVPDNSQEPEATQDSWKMED